ncbi:LysR family transcriptional regulator, partial [Streptomyces sp. wa1063]|uniref:LysR family transcriptional regulator n=1 Tax=Streptomyces sp. wa1063 TaxID=1828212 RepID=UPI00117C83CD
MSLRQMEYFVAVVEESSFTRAAERLHVTQPALSHQIKALERTVGGELLERLPRGVLLTQMGRALSLIH